MTLPRLTLARCVALVMGATAAMSLFCCFEPPLETSVSCPKELPTSEIPCDLAEGTVCDYGDCSTSDSHFAYCLTPKIADAGAPVSTSTTRRWVIREQSCRDPSDTSCPSFIPQQGDGCNPKNYPPEKQCVFGSCGAKTDRIAVCDPIHRVWLVWSGPCY